MKNNWASDEGEPRDWIKDIQDEINYLRMKGIDVDEVFSVLMKIMKKVKLEVGFTDMDLNRRARMKISLLNGLEGEIVMGPAHVIAHSMGLYQEFYFK